MVNLSEASQSAIEAHGIIGDMRTAALVSDQGSVDFFCWPEFDSPSIFCSLLDTPQAGIFQRHRSCRMLAANSCTCLTAMSCKPAGWRKRRWSM